MSIFKSWSKFFILALIVFAFAGCGGGGSNTYSSNETSQNNLSDMPGWDTDITEPAPNPEPTNPTNPEPTVPEPVPTPTPTPEPEPTEPEPTPTPEPEPTPVSNEPVVPTPTPTPISTEPTPTPEPTPEPDNGNSSYVDTYDIANLLEGNWNGISGSGMAANTDIIIGLLMSQISISFTRPQVIEDIGTTYMTQKQYWDYTDGAQTYQTSLYGDNIQNNITHIGADTWQLNAPDGTITTITLTSETTAEVTQNGPVTIDGYLWQYHINYTLHKEGSYDISALHGDWKATTPYNAGIGTATYGAGVLGMDYDVLELRVSSANLSFGKATQSNISTSHSVRFSAYRNGIYINSASPICPQQSVSIQQLENDTFKYTLKGYDTNIGGYSSTASVVVQIKLTSDITAEVTETGHFRLSGLLYRYNVFYRLNKQ